MDNMHVHDMGAWQHGHGANIRVFCSERAPLKLRRMYYNTATHFPTQVVQQFDLPSAWTIDFFLPLLFWTYFT